MFFTAGLSCMRGSGRNSRASCARAFRLIDQKLLVTLIEPKTFYFACPFSNEAIAGLREFEAQQFTYDRIAEEGVTVVAQTAVKVDARARTVALIPFATD